MKALLILLLLAIQARAVTVAFEWDANPPADAVTGYVLFEALPNGDSRKLAEVDSKTLTASGDFTGGKHSVYVIARSGGIESPPSDPVSFTVPGKPGTPRIKVVLQTSADLDNWEDLAVAYVPENQRQFFRATIQSEPK